MHAQKRIILIKEVIIIKNRVRKFSLFASIILFVVFLIFIIFDFINYDSFENSAPFYTFLIVRALEFFVPGIILFSVSKILK